MKKHSKRFLILKKLILNNFYSIDNALLLIKEISNVKFIESVEAHINLIKNKPIKESLILPYNLNKNLKIAIFDKEIDFDLYSNYNIYLKNIDEIYEEISNNKINFDILITKPIFMPKLIKLNTILSNKGLMPSLKLGTITNNIENTLKEFKQGKIEYKTDKFNNIHIIFGKSNFDILFLKQNLLAFYNSLQKYKLNKKSFINSFNICTTMSPSININLNNLK
jgi:large subunit ribosomal protein L1